MRVGYSQKSQGKEASGPFAEECVEVPLALPAWQLALLERAAAAAGLTIGAFLRRLLQQHLGDRHGRR
jgi:hypothetical protein